MEHCAGAAEYTNPEEDEAEGNILQVIETNPQPPLLTFFGLLQQQVILILNALNLDAREALSHILEHILVLRRPRPCLGPLPADDEIGHDALEEQDAGADDRDLHGLLVELFCVHFFVVFLIKMIIEIHWNGECF